MRRHEKQQGTHSRRLLKWQDFTLGVAVLVACAGFWTIRAANAATAATARIYLDDALIREAALHRDDDYRITLREEYNVPVSFEVRSGAIRFVDVDCPDHICEQAGFLSTDGQTAVCMPNRVTVIVVAE